MDDDRRQHPRFPASWRIRIICICRETGERTVIEGRTRNISAEGACVFSEHNLCPDKEFIVELSVPPLLSRVPVTITQIEARSRFSVLSSEQDGFRTGVEFLRLQQQDKLVLDRLLEAHHGTQAIKRRSPCG